MLTLDGAQKLQENLILKIGLTRDLIRKHYARDSFATPIS